MRGGGDGVHAGGSGKPQPGLTDPPFGGTFAGSGVRPCGGTGDRPIAGGRVPASPHRHPRRLPPSPSRKPPSPAVSCTPAWMTAADREQGIRAAGKYIKGGASNTSGPTQETTGRAGFAEICLEFVPESIFAGIFQAAENPNPRAAGSEPSSISEGEEGRGCRALAVLIWAWFSRSCGEGQRGSQVSPKGAMGEPRRAARSASRGCRTSGNEHFRARAAGVASGNTHCRGRAPGGVPRGRGRGQTPNAAG